MTVNHLVPGSNPGAGAILTKHPIDPIKSFIEAYLASEYDTFKKNYDTIKRLYKVDNIFYYRRRINKKLFRISLRTKILKIALYRKKILDMLENEQMYKFKSGDYELIFEYDTEEELDRMLDRAERLEKLKHTKDLAKKLEIAEKSNATLTFQLLFNKFIALSRKIEKVDVETIKHYQTTINFLNEFFNQSDINEITLAEYEKWVKWLEDGTRTNVTINKHIRNLKFLINWGFKREDVHLEKDVTQSLETLDEIKQAMERKKIVRNYTNKEVEKIISYNQEKYPEMQKIFKILAYTGMRSGELWALTNDDIKLKDNIYYINILDSKTISGIREIPIHENILDLVLNTKFPILGFDTKAKRYTKGSWQKKTRTALYNIIKEEKNDNPTLNVHTLRGTFMKNILKKRIKIKDPYALVILQEIVGHKKVEKTSLTMDIYGKGNELDYKSELVHEIDYFTEELKLSDEEEKEIDELLDTKFEIE